MSYIVLVDAYDGDPPETVWIEADSETEARDRAAGFCYDENDDHPFRPVGPAERVTVTVPHDDETEEQDPRAEKEQRAREALARLAGGEYRAGLNEEEDGHG